MNGFVEHAAKRAFPAGMGRADDAIARIGKQDRAAIGRSDAHGKAGSGRNDSIRLRGLAKRPGFRRMNGNGGMDLVRRCELAVGNAERGRHAAAILDDRSGIIIGAAAAIERCVNTRRNAALAREETVGDARRGEGGGRDEKGHQGFPNPGGVGVPGGVTASTLNRAPIPVGVSSMRRAVPLSIVSACSRPACRMRMAERSRMPRPSRKSRCDTGP